MNVLLQRLPRIEGKLWRQAAVNTSGCLLGCSIGDLGTIFVCQLLGVPWPVWAIMGLAMANGILTSFALETVLLLRSLPLAIAARTAFGMSILSMLAMELAMNATDLALVGGARLEWWVIPPMLVAGFVVPYPYNLWRLWAHGKSCH